jgi:hypothetical protein
MWTKEQFAAHNKAWREKHKEERTAYMKAWRGKNREHFNKKCRDYKRAHPEYWKSYYQTNKEHLAEKSKKWYHANKENIDKNYKQYYEKNKQKMRDRSLKWKKENSHRSNANCRRYFANKLNATPQWANHVAISCYYEFAALKTKLTGERWEVDHIVPLQSKVVCGLHTDWNLQVIPKSQNISKHNNYWPEMP